MNYLDLYRRQFSHPEYNRHAERTPRCHFALDRLPRTGTVLDVGTGRGELAAALIGRGNGVITFDLDRFHDLPCPFVPIDLSIPAGLYSGRGIVAVACLDVLEHLNESDLPTALGTLAAAPAAVLSVANHAESPHGEELHPTRRGPEWWGDLLRRHWRRVETAELCPGLSWGFDCHAPR